MSRIGKKPVPVPSNVTATVTGQTFLAQHGAVGWFPSFAPEKTLVKDGTFTVEELAAGIGRFEVPALPVLYAPPPED